VYSDHSSLFHATAPPPSHTLSLHDALPICCQRSRRGSDPNPRLIDPSPHSPSTSPLRSSRQRRLSPMLESTPSLALAWGAGVLTFLSPCVLPLVPSYLALIGAAGAGTEARDLRVSRFNIVRLLHAVPFVLGFSVVFLALGWSAGWVGEALLRHRVVWQRAGAVVVAVLALTVFFPDRFPWLMVDRRLRPRRVGATAFGAFLTGLGFAAGWTPCIGPVLGSILILSSTDPGRSTLLLGAYAAGVALPFLLSAAYAPSLG